MQKKQTLTPSLKAIHPEWASRATVSLLRLRGRKNHTQWVIFLQTLSPPSTDMTLRRLASCQRHYCFTRRPPCFCIYFQLLGFSLNVIVRCSWRPQKSFTFPIPRDLLHLLQDQQRVKMKTIVWVNVTFTVNEHHVLLKPDYFKPGLQSSCCELMSQLLHHCVCSSPAMWEQFWEVTICQTKAFRSDAFKVWPCDEMESVLDL